MTRVIHVNFENFMDTLIMTVRMLLYIERYCLYSLSNFGIFRHTGVKMATDAVSDLLFGFQQMQADDHECLVKRFCELIPGSMPTNAQFYLESFNWSVF